MLTVDVEPDWGVSGGRAVQEVLPGFCDLLAKHDVRATFFVASDMLDTCGDALKRMAESHEVASHGMSHRRLDRLSPGEVKVELTESRRRLRAELGQETAGFRAPFLRVPDTWPAALAAAGYQYDSSVGCVAPSVRNISPAKWQVSVREGLFEIPTTTLRTGVVPFCLTYLRLLAPLGEKLVAPRAQLMYLHLHELADPQLARLLPAPLRWALRIGAGRRAWAIMERLVRRLAPRAVTCSEFLKQWHERHSEDEHGGDT